MTYNEHSKNHQGTLREEYQQSKRLYANGDDEGCPVNAYKEYVSRLNPQCEAFYQRPKRRVSLSDAVWYENVPVGHNTLGNMMKVISKEAELSKIYTNHSIRATAIVALNNAGVEDRVICSLSGHRNAQSLRSYCSDASSGQKRQMTSILTNHGIGNAHTISAPPSSSDTSSSSASSRASTQSVPTSAKVYAPASARMSAPPTSAKAYAPKSAKVYAPASARISAPPTSAKVYAPTPAKVYASTSAKVNATTARVSAPTRMYTPSRMSAPTSARAYASTSTRGTPSAAPMSRAIASTPVHRASSASSSTALTSASGRASALSAATSSPIVDISALLENLNQHGQGRVFNFNFSGATVNFNIPK